LASTAAQQPTWDAITLSNVTVGAASGGIAFEQLDIAFLAYGTVTQSTSTSIQTQTTLDSGTYLDILSGNIIYDTSGHIVGGTFSGYRETLNGSLVFDISGFSISATTFRDWVANADDATAFSTIFSGPDTITGSAFNDQLSGYGGDDTISGGAGNDTIDGGSGTDVVLYAGRRSDFTISFLPDGTWKVADNRSGAPEGVDILTHVETLRFTDGDMTIGVDLPTSVEAAFQNLMRVSNASPSGLAPATLIAARLAAGVSETGVVSDIIKATGTTTSVATLSYEFFTGKIPSQAGIDYLVSPTGPNANNLNSPYYTTFNLENRYINFAVNLGKAGEGQSYFGAKYGNMTLFDATKTAYGTIFGETPTDAKVHALIDGRTDYFASYGQDGASGIGTKAAMVGWLLAEAFKADTGMYAKSNDAFLTDLADGATFAVDIVGAYGKPEYILHAT
jgi:Ca2+-binding RTX toxin-like protein